MTLAVRVIPCLDVARGRVVKGTRFVNLRDAGDPVEAAVRYEAEGADEIAFLDISAATEGRGTLLALVERVAAVLSIPFTVGGGVRSVEDAGALLLAGADRVTVNTAAVRDPGLISGIAERFGSQCVVVAVDGKRVDGRMRVTTHGGRDVTDLEVTGWSHEAVARGAGEILLTSVDADGTKAGFDVEMLRAVRAVVSVPIVASGGAGTLDHFADAVLSGGADAVLAASVFHDRVFSIGQVKRAMASRGVPVRLERVAPRFLPAADGPPLVPVVVRDVRNGAVLTLAYASEEALRLTRETGFSHFHSRSRRALWKKGETSGHVQRVVRIALDCDGDALLYDVLPEGPACHTGESTCFHVSETLADVPPSLDLSALMAVVAERKAHPDAGSYTNRLLDGGVLKVAKKVGEEAVEVALAAAAEDDDALAGEIADLLYHVVVLMAARGLDPSEVEMKLRERRGKRRDP